MNSFDIHCFKSRRISSVICYIFSMKMPFIMSEAIPYLTYAGI